MAGETLVMRFGPPVEPAAGRRIAAAGGIVIAGVIVAAALTSLPRDRSDSPLMASLVAAASSDARPLEPRISGGFPWAPYRDATRGGSAASTAMLSGLLDNARGSANDANGEAARHVEGVVYLLSGRARDALAPLEESANTTNDPRVWNDLAAAYHETALRHDAPELLANAVTAADRALAGDAQLPEALFNRALVLQRLGLRDDAREAWTRYLAADATSEWANEARQHLRSVAAQPPFLEILDRQYERVRTDAAAAMTLVRDDPFSARGRTIMTILGRWGDAATRGDAAEADRHLDVARQLGAAVSRASGDRMLEHAVAAIDAATDATRPVLAAAHAGYRSGLAALQENRPVDAEKLLRRAAAGFDQARSPAVLAARYFAANAMFEQGRHDEAQRDYETLLAGVSADFPAYRAHLLSTLGSCHTSRGDWGSAIPLLQQGTDLFERIGETPKADEARRLLGFVYDRIGDPATAWKHHLTALRGIGRQSSRTLAKAITSIADAAIVRRDWHLAWSFLNLQVDIARRIDDQHQLAEALFIRAVVRDRLSDPHAAADIAEARELAARATDPAYRAYLQAASLRATAMLRNSSPAEADALLTAALDYQTARSDRLNLPILLLQRARARRGAGNVEGAMADLLRGVGELERHRRSLPEGDARWGAFHAAEELFEEGIDLSLSNGDAEAAFRFAESARARALLDSYRRSPLLDHRRLAAGTVVVEYAALPSRLVVFTADRAGIRAVTVACTRETLAAEIGAFSRNLRSGAADDGAAKTVFRRLIEPVAAEVLGASTIVFVPDRVTSAVPFSALPGPRGEYLLELHAIVVAPSAAVFAAAAERRSGDRVPASALIISTSKAAAGGAALPHVETEARRVARAYAEAVRIHDDGAELDELVRRGPDAEVIHFAGHAVGDDRGIEPASMVLRKNGQERRVGVAEIARLRLERTRVVVLAGCSTARGERRAAEGVISVAHGFLTAGAPSVIATLWPIDDGDAAVFFPRLHERIAEGLSPAEALRAAQLDSIRRGDVPASLWAAVQNIGS